MSALITRVWKSQPGKYFCISSKARDGKWTDHFFKRGRIGDVPAFLKEHSDKDLYFCPHGFSRPRRLKKYAEHPTLLWADLDEADPRKMEKFTPSIAWESSPGRYACLWFIDKTMTEDLNRRLTYHLHADPGGWDLTQVLRVPGTTNFKYTSTPRVRLLWADGIAYTFDAIMALLPAERKTKKVDVATGLYRKYEKNLSAWCRRQLLGGKPKPGKRSEVFWRLVNELTEAGASTDDAYELLRVSPWNKFAKRRDGDEQLKREIEKSIGRHIGVIDDESKQKPAELYADSEDEHDERDEEPWRPLAKPLSDVEEEELDWLWYPYLARGELTILEGDPGLGKSYLAQMISKAICDGDTLPCGVARQRRGVSGVVAYFDMENSVATVTKKRMACNGLKNGQAYFQEEQPFSIDDEEVMEVVYDAIRARKPTLVVFDTLNTYIGKADTNNAAETQQAMNTFIEIAKRFKCAVLVLRHLTKNTKTASIYRGQGSIAFTGKARVVMTVGQSPDDPDTRVMAVTKINVARPPRALTYKIEEVPDTLKESGRSRFVWGDFVDLSVDDILAVDRSEQRDKKGKINAVDECKTWLREQLQENGTMSVKEINRLGGRRSYDEQLLQQTAEVLGVVKTKSGWSLPDN